MAPIRKAPAILWLLLILAGLVIAAMGFFDPGVFDTGDPRLSQPTCEDLRNTGADTTGCLEAEDILDRDGKSNHWWLTLLGIALVVGGLWGMMTGGRFYWPPWGDRPAEPSQARRVDPNGVWRCPNCEEVNGNHRSACSQCGHARPARP